MIDVLIQIGWMLLIIAGFIVGFCGLLLYIGFAIWSVAILDIKNVFIKALLCMVAFCITPMLFSCISVPIVYYRYEKC